MTPTDNPYRALELVQLAADLKSALGPASDSGYRALAERLYDRGVRSKLQEPPNHCPRCEWEFDELDDGRIPFHKRSFMTDWMECPGSRQLVSRPSTELTFRRAETLPEAVQRVIRLVAVLHQNGWESGHTVFTFHGNPGRDTAVSLGDLEATLAEIPDVAPRYPTIWAYEQACRTIRERDDRIEKALEKLDRWFTGKWAPSPDDVDAVRLALRLRIPRVEPATEELKSLVTRALEACESDDEAEIGDIWPTVARTLAAEVWHLRALGDTLAADLDQAHDDLRDTAVLDEGGQPVLCGTCSALDPPRVTLAVGRSQRNWPRCATHLVEDALEDAGLEKDTKRCPSCHHLSSSHFEDGSGCSVTIRDVIDGHDNHCPCTFDARNAGKQVHGE